MCVCVFYSDSVEDGFKIVVIVEADHAYENLDLPLLNRFEKQLLRPSDLLSPLHLRLMDDLNRWITIIYKECGLKSPGMY